MGVDAVEVAKPFEAKLERLKSIPIPAGKSEAMERAAAYEISHGTNNAFIAANRLFKAGARWDGPKRRIRGVREGCESRGVQRVVTAAWHGHQRRGQPPGAARPRVP